MDSAAAETACLSGGEVAAELEISRGFGKIEVTKAPGLGSSGKVVILADYSIGKISVIHQTFGNM